MKRLCALALFFSLTALPVPARQDFGGPTGELAQLFRQINGTNLVRRSIEAWLNKKPEPEHGITEIGIERTRCYGTCPAYTFIVQSNGTFRYTGRMQVERKGEFTGKIEPFYFQQLARFIKDSGFVEMEDEYDPLVTDNPTTYTTIVMNGKRKLIRNYARSGPSKLWAVEQLIDALMTRAKWDEPAKVEPAK